MARIKGIAVPFRFTSAGYPEPATEENILQDSIRSILSTTPGERVMRPDFGCWLIRLVHENLTTGFALQARSEVFRALRRHEPRIQVLDVRFKRDESRNALFLDVEWSTSGIDRAKTTIELGE